VTTLAAELSRAGHAVPEAVLRSALHRADIRLSQGQRATAEAHLAEVARLARA
jgi:hypothetical protein